MRIPGIVALLSLVFPSARCLFALSRVWGYFHVAPEKAEPSSIDKGAALAVG
jgi:hypothetical protein